MNDWYWTHPALPRFLDPSFIPLDTMSVLDVGCGKGVMGAMLRLYRSPRRIAGVDVCDQYLSICAKMGHYDELHHIDLSRDRSLPFTAGEFDLVLCIDVLEHMPYLDAMRLVGDMERVARRRVIVSTGGKENPQDEFDLNPYQRHRCAIHHKAFQRRGYHIEGTGPLTIEFRGRMVTPPYIGEMMAGVVRHLPTFAHAYIAVSNGGRTE